MSSHREAPEISKDPVADSTDVYAFVSPDRPDTVTIITNYIPLEDPAGGPNFFEFGDDVLYRINIDNDSDGKPELIYEFTFETVNTNRNTFLYNTGPIDVLDSPNFNRRQYMTVHEVRNGRRRRLGRDLQSPPCNVGIRSTPNYGVLADSAIYDVGDGIKVFAGQRLDGFYVDLGSVFDLAALRPFQNLHLIPTPAAPGVNALRSFNVHTIAIQVPIGKVTANGTAPTDPLASNATIGVWASASRRKATLRDQEGKSNGVGPYVQVSRLGNPLFNEVLVPLARKDEWNGSAPHRDKDFLQYVTRPELGKLLPVLYPGVFPNLATLTEKDRGDLVAILLTGIPAGIIPGFQNFTGSTYADQLRLNLAIPPSASPNINGILGGDLAGFPNGRRVFDDVVTIELIAVAGVTYPLVAPSYVPDGAAGIINDGTAVLADVTYLDRFPYLDHPVSGYDVLPLSDPLHLRAVSGHHHDHDHGPLEAITHVHGGAMVLDIGGSVGALHVLLGDQWAGHEVFLATADPAFSTHTGVWLRHVGDAHIASALFAALEEGTYRVLGLDGEELRTVEVRGGELTEVDLVPVP